MALGNKVAAEFIGTFWLVFGGCGSAVLAAGFPELGIGFLGVALAFGLTVMTMAYAIGHVSGCHLNPAVSVGFAVGRHFPWSRVATYSVAQVAGATLGALALRVTLEAGNVAIGGMAKGSGMIAPDMATRRLDMALS